MVLWVVTGGSLRAGIDLEMHTMVESTDLSWRAVGKQDEGHGKGGREDDAGGTYGWG